MLDLYDQIYKRRSFHLFRGTGMLTEGDLKTVNEVIDSVEPLDRDIKVKIRVVKADSLPAFKAGASHCILFYSEKKGNYLRNIGYIGEQIDLMLTKLNFGTLWFGFGKADLTKFEGLDYVIMMAIGKADEGMFRKDMFKAKRRPVNEFWEGDTLGIAQIVRFSPSAVNSQPWYVEKEGDCLNVYRYKKQSKIGLHSIEALTVLNRIDIGIFLLILEQCLSHEGYSFTTNQFEENEPGSVEKVLVARYYLNK